MSTPQHPDLDTRRRRLLFRANHRGTHENDLLIGGFVSARIGALTEIDLDALEEILELPDVMLADWLTGRAPIPAAVDTPMLRRIRDAASMVQPSPNPLPQGERASFSPSPCGRGPGGGVP